MRMILAIVFTVAGVAVVVGPRARAVLPYGDSKSQGRGSILNSLNRE
jgi:hypothetical protein